MFEKLLQLLRPQARRRTEEDDVRDRKIDAPEDLVDGRAMTADGGIVDFESDSEPPRESPGL